MTEDRLPLMELLQKAGEGDFLRSVAEAVLQLLMETDAEGLIGAGRHHFDSLDSTYQTFAAMPRRWVIVVDGLALGALPDIGRHLRRNRESA